MKLSIVFTKKFKKDFKKLENQERKLANLRLVISNLSEKLELERKHQDHQLKGEYKDCRECHIEPDLLLIYKIENDKLILIRCGSHNELFD